MLRAQGADQCLSDFLRVFRGLLACQRKLLIGAMFAMPSVKRDQTTKGDMTMLALIATPTREFVARQKAVLASWTIAERKQRAVIAQIKQQELGPLLSMPILRSKD